MDPARQKSPKVNFYGKVESNHWAFDQAPAGVWMPAIGDRSDIMRTKKWVGLLWGEFLRPRGGQ